STSSSQAFIISGDSGAGKTETAKVLVEYFTYGLEKSFTVTHSGNILLEAFGNATTLRNRNSSRFGKFSTLHFNKPYGDFKTAKIQTYLLESSRYELQNFFPAYSFHVFYYLLSRNQDQHKSRDMKKSSICDSTFAVHKEFEEAMKVLNLEKDFETMKVWDFLKGIALLGGVEFVSSGGGDDDDDDEAGDSREMSISAGRGFKKNENSTSTTKVVDHHGETERITVSRSATQAYQCLTALRKTLYNRLFTYEEVLDDHDDHFNRKIKNNYITSKSKSKYIGILDIYGFEQLAENSLEQMCINLANERLQSL
ncbi:unnamed protein product, partial [Amoebophrya sp. A120]